MALIPEHIGPYRVLRPIAAGGMAEVYEVEDPASGERFALKLLVAVKQALPRFDREYEAMTRLNHPGIVRVYHYGLHDGQPWLTMELLRGQPAQTHLKQMGRAGDTARTAEVLRVGYHVAQALHYIHDRTLIHRDLKSANVLVLPDGRVKLIDFGAAWIADSARRITQEGEFIGTFSYCSPEQLAGHEIDPRSDLFSLGVLLFRLATGKRPFEADDAVALAAQHRSRVPLVTEMVPELPEGLGALISELLAFDPEGRPSSANHVAQRLEQLAGRPISSRSRLAIHNNVSVAREAQRRQVWSRIEQSIPGWIALEGEDGSDRVRLLERLYLDAQQRDSRAQLVMLRRTGAMDGVIAALEVLCQGPDDRETLAQLAQPAMLAQPPRRAQLRAHACDILQRAAATQPVQLLIGELHRADTLTLELIGGIARELQQTTSPVHLVASVRRSVLDDRLSDLTRRFPPAHRIPLEALTPRDVAVAVGTMLGRRPPAAELSRRLHLATSGQPLFVEQAVQAMVQTGGIEADGSRLAWADQAMDIPVPPYALGVAEGQLEALPVAWRRVLEAAAVVGPDATLPLLARVMGWEAPALVPIIEGLERAGVLDLDPKSLRARWRQPVAAQMVLARIAPARHRALMRQLVSMSRGLQRTSAVVDAQIAVDLFEQAVRDGVPLARSLLAAHEYREALVLLDGLTQRPHRARKNPLLAEAFLLHAECMRAVRPADPQAGRSLARAKELTPTRDADLSARLLLGQGRLYGGIGHYRNAEKYVRQAWDTVSNTPSPLKGEIALELAKAARLRGELHSAEGWFDEAIALAEATSDSQLLWRASAGGAGCILARGRLGDAEQALSRTMQEAGRAEDAYAFAAALASWTEALRHQGRYSEALSQLYQRIPEASQLQDPEPYVRLLLATAWIELDLSRLGRAQECTDTLVATIHRGELLHVRLEVQLLNGRILLASGQYRSAVYTLEEVHQSARKAELTVLSEHARAVLAEAMYAIGDREGGRSMFQSALLGLLGTGDLTLLAEAVRGRARVEATTCDPQEIFRPVAKFLDDQPVALLRLEQLLARAAWNRATGDARSAAACHREAAMVLNRIATGLNDTDRAALRVHPWSGWIRRGLVAQAGRGKGPA